MANLPSHTLILERGDIGLGFNIRGGSDIPHVPGDDGIYVTRLKEEGAAYKDGRLKEGDKILSVNGKSIEHVTHHEAVQIFITAGNRVEMIVQHGAYQEQMKRFKTGDSGNGSSSTVIGLGILTALAVAGIGAFIYMRSLPKPSSPQSP